MCSLYRIMTLIPWARCKYTRTFLLTSPKTTHGGAHRGYPDGKHLVGPHPERIPARAGDVQTYSQLVQQVAKQKVQLSSKKEDAIEANNSLKSPAKEQDKLKKSEKAKGNEFKML